VLLFRPGKTTDCKGARGWGLQKVNHGRTTEYSLRETTNGAEHKTQRKSILRRRKQGKEANYHLPSEKTEEIVR